MFDEIMEYKKEELSTVAEDVILLSDPIRAFAIADKLEKVAAIIKEKTKENITETIKTDLFTIKVTTIPVYKYQETHELKTLEEEQIKKSAELDSVKKLIKNIKTKQEIDGIATKEKDTYRREVV